MIHVEYSFCRIRLPTMGFTLPWQLVAAHEPGPRYLMGSFSAASSAGIVINHANKTTRSMQELEASRILCAAEAVCLYLLRRAEVNGPRCLFRAAAAKSQTRAIYSGLPSQ